MFCLWTIHFNLYFFLKSPVYVVLFHYAFVTFFFFVWYQKLRGFALTLQPPTLVTCIPLCSDIKNSFRYFKFKTSVLGYLNNCLIITDWPSPLDKDNYYISIYKEQWWYWNKIFLTFFFLINLYLLLTVWFSIAQGQHMWTFRKCLITELWA